MKRKKRTISIVLFTIAVICLVLAILLTLRAALDNLHTAQTVEELQASVVTPVASPESESGEKPSPSEQPELSSEAQEPAEETDAETSEESSTEASEIELEPERIVNPYKDCYLANTDMVAWIQIPETEVDYPVMWTPRDEEYYLLKDFDGSYNKNGCLILDTDSCVDPLTTNLIIHGHNMKSGAMFGSLMRYEKEAYYKEHPSVILYTQECKRNYEIIAVFYSQVYKKTDNVFKFYQFFEARSEEEFRDFYDNIKKLSLYDTGVTAEYGDHFLTLSTCSYQVEQGRFVVVAKETDPGDFYLPIEN